MDDGEELGEDEDYDADEYENEYGDDEDEYEDDEYDDEYDAGPSRVRMAVLALGVAIFVVLGWFVVRPALGGDDAADEPLIADTSTTSAPPESDAPDITADDAVVTATSALGEATATDVPAETEPPEVTATEAPVETEPPGESSDATPPTTDAAGGATYETLPDGTPAPIVALFDVDSVTVTGAVPSQRAKDRLLALAKANAKPGQADTIVDNVTINPDVPIGIGVRVVELTSVRFPELKTEVLPAHAAELDRVVAVMNALPNVTALVIGHADQRGDPLQNLALSEQRADAVVNYMASQGIAPERLASRAVGASDLLALRNDEAAFALNRRTEFVLYGLLVE
jgi:outer membrane protein OmpA-like peptidoglycan-associated protein